MDVIKAEKMDVSSLDWMFAALIIVVVIVAIAALFVHMNEEIPEISDMELLDISQYCLEQVENETDRYYAAEDFRQCMEATGIEWGLER